MTIQKSIYWGSKKLHGFSSATLDSELLLGHVLGKTKEYLYTNDNEKVPWLKWLKFNSLIAKRSQGVPVAYMTCHKEFFGLDFYVNKQVLIPRPETEQLIEEARNYLDFKPEAVVVDVGTGSGAIAITIKKLFPNAEVIATDISSQALDIAKKNAQTHGVELTWRQGDLLSPIQSQVDLYLANLPYLTPSEADIVNFEPRVALISGAQGLDHYRQMMPDLAKSWKQGNKAIFEIGYEQGQMMIDLVRQYLPDVTVEIKKDLAGLDRLVIIS